MFKLHKVFITEPSQKMSTIHLVNTTWKFEPVQTFELYIKLLCAAISREYAVREERIHRLDSEILKIHEC